MGKCHQNRVVFIVAVLASWQHWTNSVSVSQFSSEENNNMAERGRVSLLAFGAVVAALLVFDFNPVCGSSNNDAVPKLKLNNLMGPSLRFLYCYS
ncbi:hypothetical protein Pcinc_003406 [Petrolisthes cinctipes]|uniref:Transmembrane protein n=1 Tax=Petrolisthes cinctipes TaxID=88211 RepID=A0AAE1GNT8_PETCI|nr:hypothetical protein Pcinc_003406 [Petrolisthes cinctipes]